MVESEGYRTKYWDSHLDNGEKGGGNDYENLHVDDLWSNLMSLDWYYVEFQ